MRKYYNILLIILTIEFVGCGLPSADKPPKEEKVTAYIEEKFQPKSDTDDDTKTKKKYTRTEILNLIVGKYIASECTFELNLFKQNKKLHYQIKTTKRNVKGVAKILIDKTGYVHIIFPIEWDDYQGDMTQDTYEPDKEKKPQEVCMSFFKKSKILDFQNYGNAMNNYIIFDECDVKSINLKREKSNR